MGPSFRQVSGCYYSTPITICQGDYYIIVETWGRLAYTEMYAGVLAMSLLGLTLYFVVDELERRLCPWLAVS